MAILVTRPGEDGIELCHRLTERGYKALHHPLITITAGRELTQLCVELAQYDLIMAVSQSAVSLTQQGLQAQGLPWPTNAIYLAIGQKTAQVLSKACQQPVHYPEISDSEHLLELPVLQEVHQKRMVILRGNGGRELISQTLTQRSAQVWCREVYRRVELPFDWQPMLQRWQQVNVDTLIITSLHQLTFFMSQLTAHAQAWACQLRLLVPSERIGREAITLGFQHIVITGSAANHDLVAALQP
ncbi:MULTISPECIES: uroporphyrinogen-III synthase [unclassified Vibrio]|uniref:uroporphyrinogen-III synthase n=1 Tax=unclassified Vibrio TaxID=2614977 RepID=UPI001482A96A|nr:MULTISPECIES: uroporphyrinogen-III synthase [unclassified Vibrio]NNN46037.1 uroporphyrinogen-III synthase [Vibrio sp. 1-1(7)]NNN73897.1 uroporphyrinogen-III synthase [Vibrio sp. 12-2(3-a)]